MIPDEWFLQARDRIFPYILSTPVITDPEGRFFFKMENHQYTGSFKLRGALNKVLSLQDWELANGLVSASAGNHGRGVALSARIRGTTATIFAPKNVSAVKLTAMREMGADVIQVDGGYELAEREAQAFALENNAARISPYNDGQVIAGQGTIALEMLEQIEMHDIRSCIVPVGGGGMISGIGLVLKERYPSIQMIGVQPVGSPFMHGLFYQGNQDHIIETPGLADGLQGQVESGSLTIPMVKSVVDEIVLVSELEIENAIAHAWYSWQEIIEGSAAVALAAALSGKMNATPSIVIISGGNITTSLHQQVIGKYREDTLEKKR